MSPPPPALLVSGESRGEATGHRAPLAPAAAAAWPGPRSPRPGLRVPKGRANKRHTPRPWLVQRQGLAGARGGGAGQRQEKGSAGAGAAGGLREPCPAGCALPAAFPTVALPLGGSGSVPVPSPAPARDPPCSSAQPAHPLRLARAGMGGNRRWFGGDRNARRAPGTWHRPQPPRLAEELGYSVTFNLPSWKLLHACLTTASSRFSGVWGGCASLGEGWEGGRAWEKLRRSVPNIQPLGKAGRAQQPLRAAGTGDQDLPFPKMLFPKVRSREKGVSTPQLGQARLLLP